MKKSNQAGNRILDFLAGKGFYVVLFLCIAAIGVSGYMLLSAGQRGTTQARELMQTPAPVQTPGGSGAALPEWPTVVTPKPTQSPPEQQREAGLPVMAEESGIIRPSASPPVVGNNSEGASPPPADIPSPTPAPIPKPTIYVWPVSGTVVTPFAKDDLVYNKTLNHWRVHVGVDIAAPVGAQVAAISDGEVTNIYEDVRLGTTVEVTHGKDLISLYSNLMKEPTVAVGDTVKAGDVIGGIGETSMGEMNEVHHLHLEVFKGEEAVDPLSVLPPKA